MASTSSTARAASKGSKSPEVKGPAVKPAPPVEKPWEPDQDRRIGMDDDEDIWLVKNCSKMGMVAVFVRIFSG